MTDAELALAAENLFIDQAASLFVDEPRYEVEIGPAVVEPAEIQMDEMFIDRDEVIAKRNRPVAFAGWEPRGPVIHGSETIRLARAAWVRWQQSPQQGVAGFKELRVIGEGTLIVEEIPDQVGRANIYFMMGVPRPGESATMILPGDDIVVTTGLTFVIGMPLGVYRSGQVAFMTRDEYTTNLSLESGAHTDVRVGRL